MTEQTEDASEVEEVPGEAQEATPTRDWESEAADMGWQPKDEWKKDPDQWRSAEDFVKRGEEIFGFIRNDRDRERERRISVEGSMAGRLKRLEGQYLTAMERQKERHEADLKEIGESKLKAVEDGDVPAYKALETRQDALGDTPQVPEQSDTSLGSDDDAKTLREWSEKNPWFASNAAMRALATATAGTIAQAGGGVTEQIEAGEAEVRKRFPEHFETRPSTVETGGQALRRAPKAKGVAELPREAREAFDSFVRMKIYGPKDIAKYAETYWSEANA